MVDSAEVQRLAKQNKSQRAIAEELGVSRHAVRKAMSPNVDRRLTEVAITGTKGRISQERPQSMSGALVDRALSVMVGGEGRDGLDSKLLDVDAIGRLPLRKIIDIAVNTSPEIDRALWDFLRMAVPGYEIKVFTPGTREEDERATEYIRNFREYLKWKYGDESVIYRRMLAGAWMRGAMVVEVVMDDLGREAIDIATPDPGLFSFKLIDGDWHIGQQQGSDWIPMDRPTFRHVQIDPRPGRPEGRAPVGSALFPALFLLGLMQDLRRVIANQGYPRLDVSVDAERLAKLFKESISSAYDFDAELGSMIGIIRDNLADVGPGDAFVHGSFVEMNAPIGAIGTELAAIESIIAGLERMIVRGAKTDILSFAITDGAGESQSNRQWEMKVQSVKALQHPAEILLETAYEMIAQAAGFLVEVEFRFAEIRATEELRDQQTQQIRQTNVLEMLDRGFLTPNEASLEMLGYVSEAVEETFENPDGSAVAEAPEEDTTEDDPNAPDTDALGLDGEQSARVLPIAPTTVTVSTVDEINAVRAFDDDQPAFAGLLDANPS